MRGPIPGFGFLASSTGVALSSFSIVFEGGSELEKDTDLGCEAF